MENNQQSPKPDPHAAHKTATVDQELFCAGCQGVKPHKLSVDHNREIIATCDCGYALKFPLTDDKAKLQEMFDAHRTANIGQVRVEVAEAQRKQIDSDFLKMMGVSAE